MAKSRTTKDLIQDVRSLLDEDNTVALDDSRDIVPALGRGLNKAFSVLARQYPEPLLTYTMVSPQNAEAEYDIPEDAFEDRVEKIEAVSNNVYFPVKRVDFRDLTYYETSGTTNAPMVWASIGRTYRVAPKPTGTYQFRVWYLKEPPNLGIEQGRITLVNATNNYVTVDLPGEVLESSIDSNNAYISIVDKDTGVIKSSHQIQTIIGNRLLFSTSPTKGTVYGQSISGTISPDVEVDDYVCLVGQSCISPLRNPLANYIVQFAAAELIRKLGGEADMEQRILKEMERDVEKQWAGRETTLKVKSSSKHWASRLGRWRVNWTP
jgi:hypothetical protein